MIKNLDNPLMQQLGQVSQAALAKRIEAQDLDFSDYDFNALADTIPDALEHGWWYITLERFAFVEVPRSEAERVVQQTAGARVREHALALELARD